jgi:restriction system protein
MVIVSVFLTALRPFLLMTSIEQLLPDVSELSRLSLRAVVALAVRAARRRPLSRAGEAALELAEDFVEGRQPPDVLARQTANDAEQAGDILAAAAARAAIQATRGGWYPVAPIERRKTFLLVSEALKGIRDKAVAEAVRQDFDEFATICGSVFPRVGDPIALTGLKVDGEVLLQAVLVDVGRQCPQGVIIEAVSIPWFRLLEEIQRDPGLLHQFARYPRKFEEFIAAAYKASGWPEVILTPRSGDGGRDVIATRPGFGSIRFLEQCKAYSPNTLVTHDDVRAMLGVLQTDPNASKALITTTSDFQPGVIGSREFQPFMPHRLELKNGRQLRDWLSEISDCRRDCPDQ